MIFKSLKIRHYSLLENSKAAIKKLSVMFTQPIIILIGDNGSGKSSLFEAITPYGQNKEFFSKNGKVNLVAEHYGVDFNFGVDYSKKPAYYFDNGTNLNESGNVTDQEDLVDTLFGYSPQLDKLLRMNYRMSAMTKKDRKELLMFFNPHELSLVLERQKKISSSLRGIKANVKLLSQRKLILEDKAVSADELSQIQIKVKVLLEERSNLEKAMLIANQQLEELKPQIETIYREHPNIRSFSKEKKKEEFFTAFEALKALWKTDGDSFRQNNYAAFSQVSYKVDDLNNSIIKLEREIDDKLKTLAKYKAYQKLDLVTEINPRKERLKTIEEELSKRKPLEGDGLIHTLEISDSYINTTISETLPILRLIFDELIECDGKLLSMHVQRNLEEKISNINYKIKHLSVSLEQYKKSRTDAFLAEQNLTSTQPFPMNCTSTVCSLKNNVEQQLIELRDSINKYDTIIASTRASIAKYERVVIKLNILNDINQRHRKSFQYLLDRNTIDPWIFDYLCEGRDLLTCVNRYIPFMVIRLNLLKESLLMLLETRALNKERTGIIFELSKLEDPNIPVKELIDEITSNLEHEIKSSQNQYEELHKDIARLTRYMKNEEKYISLRHKMTTIIEEQKVWTKLRGLKASFDLLNKVYLISKEEIASINNQLITLEATKNEQENIRLILDQEVLPTLEQLLDKERKYTILEKALSPSDGFPKSYLISYLNNIIANTNVILAQTWHDDIELIPLRMEDEIDFNFKRIVNGKEAKDISFCSASQKDIIDIAWNLSMIITLGYGNEFPIFLDECDKHFDEGHRERLIILIDELIRSKKLRQIFLINHHAALSTGLSNAQTICISSNNISVPAKYNEDVVISYK